MNVFTTRFLHHVTSYILVKADISTQELSKTVQLKPKPPTGHMKNNEFDLLQQVCWVCVILLFLSLFGTFVIAYSQSKMNL